MAILAEERYLWKTYAGRNLKNVKTSQGEEGERHYWKRGQLE